MDSDALDFLQRLLATPSPSGFETPVQRIVREYASSFADEISSDSHGNLTLVRNPGCDLKVMLAGHCDQIGFIVQHIDKEGFLYIQPIGGWDVIMAIGQRMVVWAKDGAVPGVVGRKPIHLLTDEERKRVPKIDDLWLDIGAKDEEEARGRVRIGDGITLELKFATFPNDLAASAGMDDKTGLWVVVEALRRTAGKKLNCSLYSVSTVQEEIGLRGARTSAYGIDPQVGIAVDVTHATDCPGLDKKGEGDIGLGRGPVVYRGPNMNPIVVDRLLQVAEEKEIKYQLAAASRATGTDANAIQTTRCGVAAGLVSIPNRYMHSPVEMISLQDIDQAADLLAEFALGLSGTESFIPE